MCGGEGIPGEGQGKGVPMSGVCRVGQRDQVSPPGTLSLPFLTLPLRVCAELSLAEEFVLGCPGDGAALAGSLGVTS